MDIRNSLIRKVEAAVLDHVRKSAGYEEVSMLNPLEPHNCVAAFAMSRLLFQTESFDYCISVAPEGHLYGYFFELLGAEVLSVHVDYPPRKCSVLSDLNQIIGKRVLILEDDVASGTTLSLVTSTLEVQQPSQIDLYLGRAKANQTLENVDSRITNVYLSEDYLDPQSSELYYAEFEEFFRTHL